jgi:hypothetical protein
MGGRIDMITKADLETRISDLRCERERIVAQTIGMYDGAIQELNRLLSSFESQKTEK